MKIVHVVRQFYPSVGGIEEVVANIARRHLAEGVDEVEVITLDRLFHGDGARLSHRDVHDGVPVRRLPYAGSSRYPLSPRVLGAVRDADVVHVHGIDFFYDYLAATAVLHGKPMIVSTHGGFFHTAYASALKRLWFGTVTRASARAYRRVIATSRNDGALFAGVVPAQQLRVIENGVDVDKFAGLGSLTPGRTLLSFGRWSANKGLIETLDLLVALRRDGNDWRLLLAGRDYDLREADLQREVAARGLQPAVEIVPAPSHEQLAVLFSRAQYFVSLSRHEGFGIAAIEAMSAGLAPILSAIPPYAKLHAESGIGALVDANNLPAAADAVRGLVNVAPEQFASRRERAMRHAARYHWRHAVAAYLDEYRAALAYDDAQPQPDGASS
jgi:alpha-1,3-mannosyltransferase